MRILSCSKIADGNCNNDFDNNGICDELQIYGCMDASANYNPDANVDNGTCIPAPVMGCVINFACNYDPNATAYVPGVCDFSRLYGMTRQEADAQTTTPATSLHKSLAITRLVSPWGATSSALAITTLKRCTTMGLANTPPVQVARFRRHVTLTLTLW